MNYYLSRDHTILQSYVDKFIILNVAQVTSLIAIYQYLIFYIKILKI